MPHPKRKTKIVKRMCKLELKLYESLVDGAPYEGKLSRTVRSGGKLSDYFKELPIAIHRYVRTLEQFQTCRRT